MLFLSFWIESVSSVCINGVSHYFYELMFIFFIGICCCEVSYFVLTTSNMYMMELANSIKCLNFYATGFSCVSPIVKDCLQNCKCLSQFRPKLWNMALCLFHFKLTHESCKLGETRLENSY